MKNNLKTFPDSADYKSTNKLCIARNMWKLDFEAELRAYNAKDWSKDWPDKMIRIKEILG